MIKLRQYAPVHALAMSLWLAAGAAHGQSPPASEEPSAPAASKPGDPAEKPDESRTLRIRGLVDAADAQGVTVQLSAGISIRVNIEPATPVFSATRISASDLKSGVSVGVRTRNPGVAGENTIALEVLALAPSTPEKLADLGVRGEVKAVETSGEDRVLVITSGGADRRLAISKETTFWRLQPAALKEVKAGDLISVLITRDATGDASAQRAVFGSAPPGAMLPL